MSRPFAVRETELFKSLWQSQSGLCAICGKPMMRSRFEAAHARIWSKQRATLDHIVPKSKGGADTGENLQLAHALCNKLKGYKAEFRIR